MEKEELGWRVSVLPIPTFHCILCTCNTYIYNSQWWNAGMGNTDTLHPNCCFCSFSIPTSSIDLMHMLACTFKVCEVCLHVGSSHVVFLNCSLQLPGQEKHFGILFIPHHIVVHEIQLSVQTCPKIMAERGTF